MTRRESRLPTLFLLLALIPGVAVAGYLYDDFEDNDISDWEPRAHAADWWAQNGQVHGTGLYGGACLLVPVDALEPAMNWTVRTSGTAQHVVGLNARLDESDTGIVAYVSPDHNVARIRRLVAGNVSTIYTSLNYDFPSGVWYDLTLVCDDDQLTFTIECPSLDQSWVLEAIDQYPQEGIAGLHMGDEPYAMWEWFEAGSGPGGGDVAPSWMTVDDDAEGESDGDDDRAFEAGEEIELDIELANGTDEDLTGAFAVLQSLHPDLSVTDNYEDYGTIPAGGSAWCLDDFGVLAAAGAVEGEVYPFSLTLFADGGFESSIELELPLGSGMSDDMEDAGSWECIPLEAGWGSDWHWSTQRNHTSGGSASMKCGSMGSGDYDDHLYCALVSPWFNAPRYSTLEFWYWMDAQLELAESENAMDGGIVQVGQYGTWHTLTPSGGYPYTIPTGTTGPFEPGTGVFSGIQGWTWRRIALSSAYAGPLRVRFVFGSDDSGNREGWYVDDVAVDLPTGIGEEGAAVTHVSLSAAPNPFGGSVSFYVTSPSASGSIEVFDLSGRLVRELPFRLTEGGAASVVWDGMTQDGAPAPSGVYLARLAGTGSGSLRLVRTR